MAGVPRYPIFVATMGAGQLVTWAILYYAFSAFILPMQQSLGWSSSLISGGFSLGLGVWALGSYGVGALIDRGWGREVMAGGTALGGLGVLLWSVATVPAVYIAAWLVIGLGMAATLYEPAFTILTRRYPGHFRQGITLLTLIGGFASTLAFPLAAWLLSLTDWRSALAVLGGILVLGIAPMTWMVLKGAGDLVPHTIPAATRDLSFAEARRTPAFWWLAAAFALHLFVSGAVWAHIVPVLDGKGLTEAQALSVLVVIGPAQVAGRLIYMLGGTGLAPQRVGVGILLGIGIALMALVSAASATQAILFGVLFGACNGLMSVLRGSLLPAFFGRASLGRIAGSINAGAMAGRSLAPLAVAGVLAISGGYVLPLWMLVGVSFGAALCVALARSPGRH